MFYILLANLIWYQSLSHCYRMLSRFTFLCKMLALMNTVLLVEYPYWLGRTRLSLRSLRQFCLLIREELIYLEMIAANLASRNGSECQIKRDGRHCSAIRVG